MSWSQAQLVGRYLLVRSIPELKGIDPCAVLYLFLSMKLYKFARQAWPCHCPAGHFYLISECSQQISCVSPYTYSSCFLSFLHLLLLCVHPEGANISILLVLLFLYGEMAKRPPEVFRIELFHIAASQVLCIGVCLWYTLSCLVDFCEYSVPPLPLKCDQNNIFNTLFCLFVCPNTVWSNRIASESKKYMEYSSMDDIQPYSQHALPPYKLFVTSANGNTFLLVYHAPTYSGLCFLGHG